MRDYPNTTVTARFEWKLPDLWIGAFWKTTYSRYNDLLTPTSTEIWICFLPCVPLHITIHRNLNLIPF